MDDDGSLSGALRTLSFKRASVELRRAGNGCPATLAVFVDSEEVRREGNIGGGEKNSSRFLSRFLSLSPPPSPSVVVVEF